MSLVVENLEELHIIQIYTTETKDTQRPHSNLNKYKKWLSNSGIKLFSNFSCTLNQMFLDIHMMTQKYSNLH